MIEVEGLEFYFRFEEIVVKKSGNKTLADAAPVLGREDQAFGIHGD
jgi:hypothetical protein